MEQEVIVQLLNQTSDNNHSSNYADFSSTDKRNECSCGAPDWLRKGAEAYTEHIHGIASLCVCIIGAFANSLNLAVLTRRELRSAPVNRILACLALADMLLMLEYIPFTFEVHLDPYRYYRKYLYPWAIFLLVHMHFAQVLHTISIMLTLLLASWRCLTLAQLTPTSPSKPNSCSSSSRSGGRRSRILPMLQSNSALAISISLCVIIPIILCSPSFFCFNVKLTPSKKPPFYRYLIVLSDLAHADDGALYHFQFWFYAVLVKLLPCVLLTALSICLIRALFKANLHSQRLLHRTEALPMITIEGSSSNNGNITVQNRSKRASKRTDRTTRMLVAVTLLFLITELPQGILGLLSGIYGPCFFLTCYQLLGDILDMLALLNGAVDFILYCAMSRQFRVTFCRLFIPGCNNNDLQNIKENIKNTGATPGPANSDLNSTCV